MKKTLRLFLVAVLAMVVGNSYASKIVFSELTPALENGKSYKGQTFDAGDFSVVFNGGSNSGKYYNAGTAIRLYKSENGTMTITAKSGKLPTIQIIWSGTYKPSNNNVVSTGSYDNTTGIWTGDAESVVFTCANTETSNWYIQAIASGDDVVAPEVPTEGQTPETAITVARALEIISALGDGKTTDFAYYVKGYVTSLKSVTTSGASFFVGETSEATNTVQTYNLKGLGNKAITNTAFVKAGDAVVVYGSLQKYVSGNTSIPEVTGGYVYSVNGNTEDTTPNPEDNITNGTKDNPMTAAEALTFINSCPDGFTTAKQYYVTGSVSAITEINTTNGNATFKMGDLTVFRVKGLENKNITDANYLDIDDDVVIYAKLQKYVSGATVTPELSSGYIYSLNGVTTGINDVKVVPADQENAPVFNLAGQKVNANYKGVVIKGGKKMIVK